MALKNFPTPEEAKALIPEGFLPYLEAAELMNRKDPRLDHMVEVGALSEAIHLLAKASLKQGGLEPPLLQAISQTLVGMSYTLDSQGLHEAGNPLLWSEDPNDRIGAEWVVRAAIAHGNNPLPVTDSAG